MIKAIKETNNVPRLPFSKPREPPLLIVEKAVLPKAKTPDHSSRG